MRETEKKGARFVFVHAQWHEDVVEKALEGFSAEMARQGYGSESIDLVKVPGVFEIPICAQKLAKSGHYAAVVCCGLVVDGGIYRHDFVSAAVVNALMDLQLKHEIPVISVVLTPLNFHEHSAHRDFFTAHFKLKGIEAAHACLAITAQLKEVELLCAP